MIKYVFSGKIFKRNLKSKKIFISGAIAVGCELLKNIALMGALTNIDSILTIIDYENIEISNLNRKFLFNNKNIG